MVDRTSGDRFANYKDLLSEIRLFTSCPELLKPLDDSEDEHRPRGAGSDKEDDRLISEHDEETNDDDEDLTNEDEELTKQLDDELSKQLDSQLSNILVGNGSSLYDSESLVSDKFSSVFSSDDEEDDLDRIVQQLQSKPSGEDAKSSMPTLSCLLTCPPSPVSAISETGPQPVQQTTDRPTVAGKNKSKISKKKVKFVQHQSKIKYAFSEDESLLNLFNKIVKNNFHPNANSKFNTGGSSDKPTRFASNKVSNEPLSVDRELDSVSVDGSISGTSSVTSSVFSGAPRRKGKDARRTNKSSSSKHRNSPKKSKSEIFTLLNSSTANSALENLFSSLRSK